MDDVSRIYHPSTITAVNTPLQLAKPCLSLNQTRAEERTWIRARPSEAESEEILCI